MGKKRKITKIVTLFLLYFFPVVYSGPAGGENTVLSAHMGQNRTASERPVRSYVLYRIMDSGKANTSFYLITSTGNRHASNTSIVVPEGTRLAVVLGLPLNITNNVTLSFLVNIDGNNITNEWFELSLGPHHIEVLLITNNVSIVPARWDVTVVSKEAYEAMTSPGVEPAGLRRKSAIVAALVASVFVPIGMYIRMKRAREEVL